MDDTRVGLMVRSVRLRTRLTQADLGARVGVSRETISRLERGAIGPFSVALLRRISDALSMPPLVTVGWRGADVARLMDEGHAAIVDRVVGELSALGWDVVVEYSFSHYGERGSVDVVGWRAATRTLLVVEVKTRIVDLQDLHATLDRKVRLVPPLLAAERGWTAANVGVVLAVPSNSTVRDEIARHAATFNASLPERTLAVRRWLVNPTGRLRGIWFLRDSRAM